MSVNYYQLLQVNYDASPDHIRKSYKRLALIYHPDKGGNQQQFSQLAEAYQTLSTPHLKYQYDLKLKCKETYTTSNNQTHHQTHHHKHKITYQTALSIYNHVVEQLPFIEVIKTNNYSYCKILMCIAFNQMHTYWNYDKTREYMTIVRTVEFNDKSNNYDQGILTYETQLTQQEISFIDDKQSKISVTIPVVHNQYDTYHKLNISPQVVKYVHLQIKLKWIK